MTIAKEICIRALRQSMGDNLERAKAAFRGLSKEEMALEHGQSGMTRQRVLDEHQRDRDERLAALAWLETR